LPPPCRKLRQAYHAERENQHFPEISVGPPHQPHPHFPADIATQKEKKLLLLGSVWEFRGEGREMINECL
jgi:hypothetical protein